MGYKLKQEMKEKDKKEGGMSVQDMVNAFKQMLSFMPQKLPDALEHMEGDLTLEQKAEFVKILSDGNCKIKSDGSDFSEAVTKIVNGKKEEEPAVDLIRIVNPDMIAAAAKKAGGKMMPEKMMSSNDGPTREQMIAAALAERAKRAESNEMEKRQLDADMKKMKMTPEMMAKMSPEDRQKMMEMKKGEHKKGDKKEKEMTPQMWNNMSDEDKKMYKLKQEMKEKDKKEGGMSVQDMVNAFKQMLSFMPQKLPDALEHMEGDLTLEQKAE